MRFNLCSLSMMVFPFVKICSIVLLWVLVNQIAVLSAESSVEQVRAVVTGSSCSTYTDCATCASDLKCSWCGSSIDSVGKLPYCFDTHSWTHDSCDRLTTYEFEDTCPVLRIPSTIELYLSNWMKELLPIIEHLTIMDISVPGTHDTLTYNLSMTVSDGGIDGSATLAKILHDYSDEIPDGVVDYIRQQAQTQDLDITQQLNNGVRFIDARMMYEYSDDDGSKDWYSLHMIQSYDKMMKYFNDIYSWVINHPSEIVVMWISKHGSTCDTGTDQYPDTPIEVKQAFWNDILNLFQDILVDVTVSPINSTSIGTLLDRGQRLYIYASDYAEMTSNSVYALDACLIENISGSDVTDEVNAITYEESVFESSLTKKQSLKSTQSFYLLSLSTGVPSAQMWNAFKIKYLPHSDKDVYNCAIAFNIPNMTQWCPETLLDISNLENYYKQITLEETIQNVLKNVFPTGLPDSSKQVGPLSSELKDLDIPVLDTNWGYPNAIYINGVDVDGTIRTGTNLDTLYP